MVRQTYSAEAEFYDRYQKAVLPLDTDPALLMEQIEGWIDDARERRYWQTLASFLARRQVYVRMIEVAADAQQKWPHAIPDDERR